MADIKDRKSAMVYDMKFETTQQDSRMDCLSIRIASELNLSLELKDMMKSIQDHAKKFRQFTQQRRLKNKNIIC